MYLQVQGTAMGTPLAPNYAKLFMGKFKFDLIYNNNLFKESIRYWSRYIDDCFMIWRGTEMQLDEFLSYINSRIPSISFTMEKDRTSIHFLDVQLFKKDNDYHSI